MTRRTQTEYSTWCKAAIGSELEVFFNKADDVLRLSLLTLVYRSVPNPPGSPTTFSPECIRAARATLNIHQDCIAIINTSTLGLFSTYMHWYVRLHPSPPNQQPLTLTTHYTGQSSSPPSSPSSSSSATPSRPTALTAPTSPAFRPSWRPSRSRRPPCPLSLRRMLSFG